MKKLATYYHSNPKELISYWFMLGSIPFLLGCFALMEKKYLPILLYVFISFILLSFGPRADWVRYSVHLLPLLYAFSAIIIVKIKSSYKKILKITILLLMLQAIAGTKHNWNNMTTLAEHQICRKKLGLYIKNNIPSNQYIASSDIGAIAYVAINHKFVDLMEALIQSNKKWGVFEFLRFFQMNVIFLSIFI